MYGDVIGSVLSHGVRIGKGSLIKNSVILPNAVIGENTLIENAVIGSETVISCESSPDTMMHNLLYVVEKTTIQH